MSHVDVCDDLEFSFVISDKQIFGLRYELKDKSKRYIVLSCCE